jgi:hypothetical protein
MNLLNTLTALLLCGLATGCSSLAPDQHSHAREIQLTAAMPSKFDVILNWWDSSSNCAGHLVEFATEPHGEYTTLAFQPSDRTTFTHPRLVPDTTFYYRVRPYFGPASAPAEVNLPSSLSDTEYTTRYAQPEDYSWGAPDTIPAQTSVDRNSIHDSKTFAAARPTNLKALIAPETVSGIHLTWTDHDSDAEGYLIEMKADHESDYKVCAIVGTNINSFGWSLAPPQRQASFRVRAYYLGHASNLVSEKTGPESEANYAIPK